MRSAKDFFVKYRALLIGVFGIVLLYTLLGFLLVPWLAERQMLQTLQQRLGVAASVESVQFNPYTFEVSVENLQLANKQYDPLASWDRLYFNLQPLQLFLLNLRIEEITIDAQKLHFRRYAVGDNTLTRLVENWNASTKEAVADDNPDEGKVSEQDGSLFTLQIGEFNYNDGQLIYRDDVPATTFKTVLSPINIHLDNFSTAAGQTAATDLVIALENDAKLTLNGTMMFPALQFTGMVNLQNFSLQIPYRYLQGQLPIELKNGLLDLKLAYDIDLSDTANIELSNVDLNLSQFSLYRPAQSSAILQGGTLIVSNGHYDFPDNQLSIDNVSAEDFKVAVIQNNQGELNWLQMLSPLLESDADDTSEDSKMPPLQLNIANLQLDNTALTLKDQQPVNPVNLALTVSADVQNFSLADDQPMTFNSQISLDSGGDISLDGQMQLFPTLALEAKTDIEQLSLLPAQPYLNKYADIEMVSGKIGSNASISINQQAPFTIKGDLTLTEVQLNNQQLDEKLISLDKLTVNSFDFSQANQKLAISEAIVDALYSRVVINENGKTNLASLIKEQVDTATKEEKTPLQLAIASLQLNNAALTLEDQQPESPVNLGLMLSADVQNFSLSDNQLMTFNSQISLDSGGNITLDGQIQLFPTLAVQAETDIEQLSLLPLQPYLNKYAHIEMVSGKINSTTSINSDQQEPFSIKGDLTLSEMQLDNQQLDEKLLALDTLSINNFDFSQANQKLAISEIIVDSLYSRILINEKGTTNLALLIKDLPETEKAEANEASSDKANDYEFSLGRVGINNASSRFTDQNLPIVFDAHMKTLNGEISGFSTQSKQPMGIDLKGQVDEFGLVVIDGTLNPLNVAEQTTIKLAFSNLDLPAMTPYTMKFAGRKIAEGRADVELTYNIVDSELTASNHIVIRDIRLGERVESPNAMELPLDLAVALLKNSNGVIELTIPVTGDVNDPQFAMGPVIRGAIQSALMNIVTAPFRFLGSLVGIGNEDAPIDEIRFRVGSSDLIPPAKEKLQMLVDALLQRPQLVLQIPAPFAATADRQALKVAAVEAQIDSRLEEMKSNQQLTKKRQQVLETLYLQAGLNPDLQILQQKFSTTDGPEAQTESQLDVLAYNATLKQRLIEAEPVIIKQLVSLAEQRQQAVAEYIKKNSKLNGNQLQKTDSVTKQLKDGWLTMKFKLETI